MISSIWRRAFYQLAQIKHLILIVSVNSLSAMLVELRTNINTYLIKYFNILVLIKIISILKNFNEK